ncbi:MAG: CCA tRNA nucleotidyltransferase [Pirellulaceae bacterium]|nr:CCA tRNA nucleotidyltransferase [Pirellulaceae bacterium]
MPITDRAATRQFALEVVRRLRAAGFEALWAGGCVRDQLMGREPKDYDVATSAEPEQVRQVFGRRRTLSMGAAFGVITVLGPPAAAQVEVATFRRDATYSDGRHPDSVTFSNAEEDALRRDFTINGLFFDPLAERVIDYVEGQRDIERRLVRAIRDPFERIAEDKLRMLRAVRFAAAFDFELDQATFEAVRRQAHEIVIVSAERVATELRRMLVHERRVRAVELLLDAGLLEIVLPEIRQVTAPDENVPQAATVLPWRNTRQVLDRLHEPTFAVALAALLIEVVGWQGGGAERVERICRRWRLSRHDVSTASRLLELHSTIRAADQLPWPRLQPLLVEPGIEELLDLSEAVGWAYDGHTRGVEHCRQLLRLPAEQLDPAPLVRGDDLIAAGIPRGPHYKTLLDQVRAAQLAGQVSNREQAMRLVRQLVAGPDEQPVS